jgi:hypothetical protein
LSEQLRKDGTFDQVGGSRILRSLVFSTHPPPPDIDDHITIVKEKSLRRKNACCRIQDCPGRLLGSDDLVETLDKAFERHNPTFAWRQDLRHNADKADTAGHI